MIKSLPIGGDFFWEKSMSACPFCQGEANCGLTQSASCWCFSESIPEKMLALLPLKRKVLPVSVKRVCKPISSSQLHFESVMSMAGTGSQHGSDSNTK